MKNIRGKGIILLAIFSCYYFIQDQNLVQFIFGEKSMLQGAIAYIGYFVLCFYTINKITKNEILNVIQFVTLGCFLVGLYAFFESLNIHLLDFIIPKNILLYKTSEKIIASTVYSPNILGQFMAINIPIVIWLYYKTTQNLIKFFSLITIGLMFYSLMNSQARFALFIFLISLILILYQNKNKIMANLKLSISLIIPIIVSIVLNGDVLIDKYYKNTSGQISAYDAVLFELETDSRLTIQKGSYEKIIFNIEENIFTHTINSSKNNFINNDNNLVLGSYKIQNEFERLRFKNEKAEFIFSVVNDRIQLTRNNVHYEVDTDFKILKLPFRSTFLTSRIYIWERTIPIILNNIFFGVGLGKFTSSFPQNDFIGKINNYNTPDIIVDKPHNLFLGFLFEFGLFGVFILLGAFYFFLKCKSYKFSCPKEAFFILNSLIIFIICGFMYDLNLIIGPYVFFYFGSLLIMWNRDTLI